MRLRAERDLAEIYGRSYGTIRRAMELLRERGLIVTIHGRGTFVASPADGQPAKASRRENDAPHG